MDNKKAAFAGSLAVGTRGDSTTSSTQHQRILQMLRAGEPVTVYRLHAVGINSATARIKELRDAGQGLPYEERKKQLFQMAAEQQAAEVPPCLH
ncbi:helix-turn-helix domain-containing protein [Neisseria shayeganii]|uniref:DNA-binding protein n=1 Tax=Neisseria shayeganii TaxID=607712 RepID=A0A7D7N6C5_9NEIS|nr:helix-turn-helix domain-containing protein [Neisseria shayeganii]QMT39821.1 hypothetical protein H3L94_08060 [Neisseria shayeganii]